MSTIPHCTLVIISHTLHIVRRTSRKSQVCSTKRNRFTNHMKHVWALRVSIERPGSGDILPTSLGKLGFTSSGLSNKYLKGSWRKWLDKLAKLFQKSKDRSFSVSAQSVDSRIVTRAFVTLYLYKNKRENKHLWHIVSDTFDREGQVIVAAPSWWGWNGGDSIHLDTSKGHSLITHGIIFIPNVQECTVKR